MSKVFVDSSDIRNLMAGEKPAFAAVYERYGDKVYRFAFKFLKDQAQSKEIVQERFIKSLIFSGLMPMLLLHYKNWCLHQFK